MSKCLARNIRNQEYKFVALNDVGDRTEGQRPKSWLNRTLLVFQIDSMNLMDGVQTDPSRR
jgi:hypothetical protein